MKKWIPYLFFFAPLFAFAEDHSMDPLGIEQEMICVVSSFESRDYFTVFSVKGIPLWEIPFNSKIQSWKIDGERLYVFSKMRNETTYFLSCFTTDDGGLRWEKPIHAPQSSNDVLEVKTD
jgi:hypothetical protein